MNHLIEWRQHVMQQHPQSIDLTLDRIQAVADQLNLLSFDCPVITITGTNGKGSCVAFLEQIYLAAGYRVGVYSTPHLLKYENQIRVDGKDISEVSLCETFNIIAEHQGAVTLTEYEWLTVAALFTFKQQPLDIIILEVCMGGQRDTVNIISPNLAIVTNVELDHQSWLGATRAEIAREKSGIFRENIPVVLGDTNLPEELLSQAKKLRATIYQRGASYDYKVSERTFDWQSNNKTYSLPCPHLSCEQAATAIMAIEIFQKKLPVDLHAIQQGIANAVLPGRFQKIADYPTVIVDVAHNPAAAEYLVQQCRYHYPHHSFRIIFSMYADKDITGTIKPFTELATHWYTAPLFSPRGASKEKLMTAFKGIKNVLIFDDIQTAMFDAIKNALPEEIVLVYGSFATVAEICTIKFA